MSNDFFDLLNTILYNEYFAFCLLSFGFRLLVFAFCLLFYAMPPAPPPILGEGRRRARKVPKAIVRLLLSPLVLGGAGGIAVPLAESNRTPRNGPP